MPSTFVDLWDDRTACADRAQPSHFAIRLQQLGLYLIVCLLTRAGLWGDWNYEVDDQFYALVGQRILNGATLYVDIWDRKGPLLYLTYAVLGLISQSVIVYQLAATLCVVWGAYGIANMAQALSNARSGFCAGLAYCLLVLQFGGANGQAAIFFEPLLITAAASLVVSREELRLGHLTPRLIGGYACAGLAITFKQSAAIEAVILGLMAIWLQARGGVRLNHLLRNSCALALVGLLPLVLCTGWFWLSGHLAAFWHATVDSNLHRAYMPPGERLHRLAIVAAEMALPLGFAAIGWMTLRNTADRRALALVTGWCLAALGSVAVYPNLINHYLLTTLPPLCVLASGLYGRGAIGLAALIGLSFAILPGNHALRWNEHHLSRQSSREIISYVRSETPDHKLLVWGWPSYLYVLTDSPPPSILAFPPHLFDAAESSTSGLNQASEVHRILNTGPSTVILQDPLPAAPLNPVSVDLVSRYVRNCAREKTFVLYDQFGPQAQKVFSQCRAS